MEMKELKLLKFKCPCKELPDEGERAKGGGRRP